MKRVSVMFFWELPQDGSEEPVLCCGNSRHQKTKTYQSFITILETNISYLEKETPSSQLPLKGICQFHGGYIATNFYTESYQKFLAHE